jgi:hypothetical protein
MTGRANLPKAILAGLVVVLVGFGLSSCAGKGIGGALADQTQEIPEGTATFVYWDTEAIAGDTDLHQLRDTWKAENEAWLSAFSIEADAVKHFLHFEMSGDNTLDHILDFSVYGNNALSVRGDFDRNSLRTQLRDRNHKEDDWKRVEVWETADGQGWLAMASDSLIGGDRDTVRDSVNVVVGDSASLYDDANAHDVMSRLPGGIMVHFYDYAKQPTGDPPYQGLVANGTSLQKQDRDRLRVELVCKFGEPEQAADALEDIRDEADLRYSNVNADQDGRFVIVTAEVDILELVA